MLKGILKDFLLTNLLIYIYKTIPNTFMYINVESRASLVQLPHQLLLRPQTAPDRATPNGLMIEVLLAWVTKEPEPFCTYEGESAF